MRVVGSVEPLVAHELSIVQGEQRGLAALDFDAAGSAACSVADHDGDLVAHLRQALRLHLPRLPSIEHALDGVVERLDPPSDSRFDCARGVDVLDLGIQ